MKPSDLKPDHVMYHAVERASELDHLVRPVQEEMDNHVAYLKLNGYEGASPSTLLEVLEDEMIIKYVEQGAYGRLYVLQVIIQMLKDETGC